MTASRKQCLGECRRKARLVHIVDLTSSWTMYTFFSCEEHMGAIYKLLKSMESGEVLDDDLPGERTHLRTRRSRKK